jgi:hypothetical protein
VLLQQYQYVHGTLLLDPHEFRLLSTAPALKDVVQLHLQTHLNLLVSNRTCTAQRSTAQQYTAQHSTAQHSRAGYAAQRKQSTRCCRLYITALAAAPG